ncbi:MAG: DUF1552 domain-containing protein [Myxococcales bacterium]|nr:DUF1552 domain-containing protein [Myxococcales bacterium]
MKIERRVLIGAGGVALALPLLQSLAPKRAHAQSMPSPIRRFILVTHGQGAPFDRWRPSVSGALPAMGSISPILAPLDRHRDRVLVISGVDNVVRHAIDDADGHRPANASILTANRPGMGPSLDFVVGERLRGTSERANILLHASPDGSSAGFHYARAAGMIQTAQALSGNPRRAAEVLFSNIRDPMTGTPTLSRRDRLRAQRSGVLSAVREQISSLRGRLPAEDRERLDAHVEHIRTLEARNVPRMMVAPSCRRPDLAMLPSLDPMWPGEGDRDNISTPAQIDNLVRALACDVTRVAALHFNVAHDPRFPWLYGGDRTRASAGYNDWHDMVHMGWSNATGSPSPLDRISNGVRFYADSFATLLDRLVATTDLDGNPLLDSTLVLWISEFGNGGAHEVRRLPVVMAGMGAAFAKGRHLDLTMTRPTTGDLYATVLRLLGGTDTTFGMTGMLMQAHADWAGNFRTPYPFHRGPIAL